MNKKKNLLWGVVILFLVFAFCTTLFSKNSVERKPDAEFSKMANDGYGNLFAGLGVREIITKSTKDPSDMSSIRFYIFEDGQGHQICSTMNDGVWPHKLYGSKLEFDIKNVPNSSELKVFVDTDTSSVPKEEAVKGFYDFMEDIAHACVNEALNRQSWVSNSVNLDQLFDWRFGGLLKSSGVMYITTTNKENYLGHYLIFDAKDMNGKTVGNTSNFNSQSVKGYERVDGHWHVILDENTIINVKLAKSIFLNFEPVIYETKIHPDN